MSGETRNYNYKDMRHNLYYTINKVMDHENSKGKVG